MAAPCKRHGGNDATRSLRVCNECTGREYAKDGPLEVSSPPPTTNAPFASTTTENVTSEDESLGGRANSSSMSAELAAPPSVPEIVCSTPGTSGTLVSEAMVLLRSAASSRTGLLTSCCVASSATEDEVLKYAELGGSGRPQWGAAV